MKKLLSVLCALLLTVAPALSQIMPGVSGNPSPIARPGGTFYAAAFNWEAKVLSGNSATGSSSIIIAGSTGGSGGLQLADGTTVSLQTVFSTLTPIIVDWGQGAAEPVTPTAVSVGTCPAGNLGVGGVVQCATVIASFTNLHGQSAVVRDGSYGLQTAINYAQLQGGGLVTIDPAWIQMGGTDALVSSAIPFPNVSIADFGGPDVEYWNIEPAAATFLAAPTTLTAVTALPSATPVGAYGTGTYHLAIAYVDASGQVGPESADFSEAGLATGSFIFSAPAASTGAVGYVIYISLTGGTYSLDYEVPLSSSICTLTRIEGITPACAVANTTYAQSGSAATVTAITVNTSPVGMVLGGVSGTLLTGNPNGRTTYGYVPSNHLSTSGLMALSLPFTVGGIGSATPIAIGTVNVPGGLFNHVGTGIRVCGKFTNTDVNSTVQNINIYLDAAGSNVAGSPVQIASLASTAGPGTAAAYTGNFCWSGTTTVAGAGATAGSMLGGFSLLNYYLSATPAGIFVGGDTKTAAVASLNLAGTNGFENRLSIVHTNTTGNNTPQLQNLTIEVF